MTTPQSRSFWRTSGSAAAGTAAAMTAAAVTAAAVTVTAAAVTAAAVTAAAVTAAAVTTRSAVATTATSTGAATITATITTTVTRQRDQVTRPLHRRLTDGNLPLRSRPGPASSTAPGDDMALNPLPLCGSRPSRTLRGD